ncbi:hypothetical protein [Actinokineospora sp. NPDC004072]
MNEADIGPMVRSRVAQMPAHEQRFWTAVAAGGVDRRWAARLLDVATEWIAAGRSATFDPYSLALSWAVR